MAATPSGRSGSTGGSTITGGFQGICSITAAPRRAAAPARPPPRDLRFVAASAMALPFVLRSRPKTAQRPAGGLSICDGLCRFHVPTCRMEAEGPWAELAQRVEPRRQMANIGAHHIGKGGKLRHRRKAREHTKGAHARRTARAQIMQTVADHDRGLRRHTGLTTKAQQLTGCRLAAITAVGACDKVKLRDHARRLKMGQGRRFGIIGRNAQRQPPRPQPVQKRDQRDRLGLGRMGGLVVQDRNQITSALPLEMGQKRIGNILGCARNRHAVAGEFLVHQIKADMAADLRRPHPVPFAGAQQKGGGPGLPGGAKIKKRAVLVKDDAAHRRRGHVQCTCPPPGKDMRAIIG
mmetsp:Transcript_7554/g.12951  ORF Transcript_7554/g.12951 Transcript_7554/m.12951 type:complete len:350 (-) Transcript_7554:293-1342(-)